MDFLASLLEHYHRTAKDLEARNALRSFSSLVLPDDYPGFQKVIHRLEEAISNKEKTVIYGDYDVDGLTSTAIRKRTLDSLGLNPGFFIPSRYHEGYGLNEERVRQFKEKGYSLIITVDNGISAKDSISLASSLGRETIVIDHHELPDILPPTPYIFTQLRDKFIPYNCSAASLALFISHSLLKEFNPYFVTLAGRAVFSDVMPLVGNNLIIARQRKKRLNQYRFPNLIGLIGTNQMVSYDDVVFTLIPSLNSPGRAKKETRATIDACRFLLENTNTPHRRKLRNELKDTNLYRKKMVQDAKLIPNRTRSSEHGIVCIVDGISGLTGLYANKIRRKEKKSIGVFAKDEMDPTILVGSFRSLESYEVDPRLSKENKRRLKGGGHKKAIGRSIREKDYFQVATDFITLREKQALSADHQKGSEAVALALEDITIDNYHVLEKFEPFGEGFPYPDFCVDVEPEWGKLSTTGKSMIFQVPGSKGKAIYSGNRECFKEKRYTYFTLKGRMKFSVFHGIEDCCLMADEITPHID